MMKKIRGFDKSYDRMWNNILFILSYPWIKSVRPSSTGNVSILLSWTTLSEFELWKS